MNWQSLQGHRVGVLHGDLAQRLLPPGLTPQLLFDDRAQLWQALNSGQINALVDNVLSARLAHGRWRRRSACTTMTMRTIPLQREQAERANAAKSQFLATASHELHTQMQAILGLLELEQQQFYHLLMRDAGPQLHVEALSALPQCVQLDSDRLQQVVNNLIANALKFTRQGDIRLTLAATDVITLTMSDTGTGAAV